MKLVFKFFGATLILVSLFLTLNVIFVFFEVYLIDSKSKYHLFSKEINYNDRTSEINKFISDIDTQNDNGIDFKTSSSNKLLIKEEMQFGEWDLIRLSTKSNYYQRMTSTWRDETIQSANNSAKFAISGLLGNIYDSNKYDVIFKAIENYQKYRIDFAVAYKSIIFKTKEESDTYFNDDFQLKVNVVVGIFNLIKQIKIDVNYVALDYNGKLKADEKITKTVFEIYNPAINNVFNTDYMNQSAGWSTIFKDMFNLTGSNLKGDVFFANGQPITKTEAKNVGATLVMTNRYSPNFINYDMNVEFLDGEHKWYQVSPNKRWYFFNQDAKKRGIITKEAWESVFAINKTDFDETIWVIQGVKGSVISKKGEDLNDDEKKQIGYIQDFSSNVNIKAYDDKINGEGEVVYLNAYSYNLNNSTKTENFNVAVNQSLSNNETMDNPRVYADNEFSREHFGNCQNAYFFDVSKPISSLGSKMDETTLMGGTWEIENFYTAEKVAIDKQYFINEKGQQRPFSEVNKFDKLEIAYDGYIGWHYKKGNWGELTENDVRSFWSVQYGEDPYLLETAIMGGVYGFVGIGAKVFSNSLSWLGAEKLSNILFNFGNSLKYSSKSIDKKWSFQNIVFNFFSIIGLILFQLALLSIIKQGRLLFVK